jgi:nucleoside-diphosphate-sugar epimerase
MDLHVVLGKGPVGSTLTDRLVAAGQRVRVLSRSGGSDPREAVEHVAVDAADAAALTAAASSAVALYNCANPAYHRWTTDWPPVAGALLEAAESTGAVLVVMSNLYGYGEVDRPMTEDLPLASTGSKGRVRAAMYEQALERHRAGALRMVEVRASDFVGPRVTDGGHLGSRAVPRLLAGRSVSFLGDPDVPHSWTAVPDVAAALELVALDERAWGRAWHVPTAPAVTFRQAVHGLCEAAGVEPVKVTRIPHLALRAVGLVSPMVRELEETRHQFVRPFLLDSSAFCTAFGVQPTPLETTWVDTLAWWRARTPAVAS